MFGSRSSPAGKVVCPGAGELMLQARSQRIRSSALATDAKRAPLSYCALVAPRLGTAYHWDSNRTVRPRASSAAGSRLAWLSC